MNKIRLIECYFKNWWVKIHNLIFFYPSVKMMDNKNKNIARPLVNVLIWIKHRTQCNILSLQLRLIWTSRFLVVFPPKRRRLRLQQDVVCDVYHKHCSRTLSVYWKTGAAREAATRHSWMAVFTWTNNHKASGGKNITSLLSLNQEQCLLVYI